MTTIQMTLNVLGFVLVLLLCTFLFNLGGHLAARLFGIPVKTFALGFGPKVWGFHRRGTDFRLGLVILGSYVEFDPTPIDPSRAFEARPYWQRTVVYLGGPLLSFAVGMVILGLLRGAGFSASTGVGLEVVLIAALSVPLFALVGRFRGRRRARRLPAGEVAVYLLVALGAYCLLFYGLCVAVEDFVPLLRAFAQVFSGREVMGALTTDLLPDPQPGGLRNLLLLGAYIAATVGLLNLLPIPMFNGGTIVLFLYEGLAGVPLAPNVRERIQQIGFVLIVILMVTVLYVDLIGSGAGQEAAPAGTDPEEIGTPPDVGQSQPTRTTMPD